MLFCELCVFGILFHLNSSDHIRFTMGSNVSRGWEVYWHPDEYPKTHMPSVFDPLYGFPNGRKKREMKVTEEEMTHWDLPLQHRDYCAHLMVDFLKCRKQYGPLVTMYCDTIRHAWETCQYEDQILRMKEYERERRLLAKERRLKEKAAPENAVDQKS